LALRAANSRAYSQGLIIIATHPAAYIGLEM
jgi:hypothetical protein